MRVLAAAVAMSLCVGVSASWASFSQPLVLTGPGASDIPASQIRFETTTGQQVPVQEDERGRLVIFFPGDRAEAGVLTVPTATGPKRIAIPAAAPGRVLRVNVPSGTVTQGPAGFPGAPGRNLVFLSAGQVQIDQGPVGAGTNIGGGEVHAAELRGRVDLDSLGLAFSPSGLPGLRLVIAGGDGNDRLSTSIAPGTDAVGIVYDDFSPGNSTGVALGANGLDTTISRDMEFTKFGGRYDFPHDYLQDGPNILSPRIGLFFTQLETQVNSFVESPTFGAAITSEASRNLQQDFFTLSVGMGFRTDPEATWFFGAGADVLLSDVDSDFRSEQINVCTLCGVSDRNFTIVTHQPESDFTVGGEVTAEFGFRFPNGVGIGIQGAIIHQPDMASIFTTRSGNDLFVDNRPTQMVFDDATNYVVALFLGLGF